jgi:DNA repair ATPase RecN
MATETKIIEIKIEAGAGIQQITQLTAEIKRLQDVNKSLDATDKAQAQQIEKNKIAIKEYTNQKRQLTNEVQKEISASQSALGAYQKLQNEYSQAASAAKNLAASNTATAKEIQAAADKANALGDRLKEIDATVGQHHRNVGNYSGALEDLNNKYVNGLTGIRNYIAANGGLAGSFKAGAQAVMGMGKQLLMLLANPIVATIAAITGAVMLLVNAFKSNGAAVEKMNVLLAPFKALLDVLRWIQKLVQSI